MKKLLILGAGIYQVPLIKTAKRMGIQTLVASIPGKYPGFEIADKVFYENTVDYEKILEIAKEEKIDGIVTAGTDVAVITIGKVCDDLSVDPEKKMMLQHMLLLLHCSLFLLPLLLLLLLFYYLLYLLLVLLLMYFLTHYMLLQLNHW